MEGHATPRNTFYRSNRKAPIETAQNDPPEANLPCKQNHRYGERKVAAHEPPDVAAEHDVSANIKTIMTSPLLVSGKTEKITE